jgi:hypothetical protein
VPAKPTGPIKFSNVLGDEVTLNWSPPKKDGGSPITSYKLEISEDGKTWTPEWEQYNSILLSQII